MTKGEITQPSRNDAIQRLATGRMPARAAGCHLDSRDSGGGGGGEGEIVVDDFFGCPTR